MKKNLMRVVALALVFACLTVSCAGAAGIRVTRRDLQQNTQLDKSVNHILVLLQDGDVTDTLMLASINSRTGRAVMTQLDGEIEIEDEMTGACRLDAVYAMADSKSGGLLACRVINGLLGLNVGTYVALDIASLPEIVEKIGTLNMQFDEHEAAAMGTWTGINELSGQAVLDYIRLDLDTDAPGRSRGYDALMQMLYSGLNSGDLMGLVSMGIKMLGEMNTNLNAMTAMTLASAVQAGDDRRELAISPVVQADVQGMRDAAYQAIYGE